MSYFLTSYVIIHSHLYLTWIMPFQKVLQTNKQTDNRGNRVAQQLKKTVSQSVKTKT